MLPWLNEFISLSRKDCPTAVEYAAGLDYRGMHCSAITPHGTNAIQIFTSDRNTFGNFVNI